MSYEIDSVGYIVAKNSIIISAEGIKATFRKGTDDYDKALTHIRENNMDELRKMSTPGFNIAEYSHLEIYVHKGKLYRFGEDVEPRLASTILKLMDDGLPYEYLLNFWDRLKTNPEPSSVDQLYSFLLANSIPITPEGYIMAYKSVVKKKNGIMYDHHSGSVEYYLHKTVTMPREKVVCSPDTACGPGLHVGSYDYAESFRSNADSILLEVIVDPKNVVSVPKDCRQQKCRTCELFVSSICKGEVTEAVYKPPKKAQKELRKKELRKKELRKKEAEKNDSPLEAKKDLKIGRYFYIRKNITSSDVEKLTDLLSDNPYKRLVKSDFPLFFKRLHVEQVYRQRNGNYSNYIAGTNSVFIQYTKV